LPEISKLTELSRAKWEELTEKFISTPANVAQRALEHFVPGGGKDPRLYKDAKGAIMIIGPDLPTDGVVRIRSKWDNHIAFGITKELFEIYDKIAGHIKAV